MRSLLILVLAVVNAQAAGTLTVVSSVTYQRGALAPESLASAFGTNLGSQVTVTDSTGTARSAPVLSSSSTEIDFDGREAADQLVIDHGHRHRARLYRRTQRVGKINPRGHFQDQSVAAIAAANPNTIVVIKSGSAVLMPWVSNVPAILEAWYPGEEDGNAVAAVLFGDVNPSGKLPVTFPVNVGDLPANTPAQYPGINGIANYSEGVFVGYRYFDANNIAPLFPFGHGLSYTTFSYTNLQAYSFTCFVFACAQVQFDVTNTGTVAGSEVAQVYVGLPNNPVAEPPLQLGAFRKVTLQPGQTAHIQVPLNQNAFSYWDIVSHAWQPSPGPFTIFVGSSSRDIRLQSQ